MFHFRLYIVALLISGSMSAFSQSPDFIIKDFHENPLDLTAATSNIIDLRGLKTALIRFSVRDTLFSFTANNGILSLKKGVGEILLFVPDGTKRITIRHPYLGVLRDYELPKKKKEKKEIESSKTYDAEIVITNEAYLQSLIGIKNETPATIMPPLQQEEIVEETPHEQIVEEPKPKPVKPHTPLEVHFLLGGGFNAISVMGPNISAGIQLGNFILSADYTIGMQKVEDVGIYYKAVGYGEELSEAYDYSASRFSVRLGIGSPKASVQIVPQIGASFNMIRGKEIVNKVGSEAQFSESNPISLSGALSLRIRLFDALHLAITPQYDFAIGADDVYKVIKSADSKVKAWGEGFGIHAGLFYQF